MQSIIGGKRPLNAIKISDSFTYSKLIRFTLPSILMMIVTSLYAVVDGLFVSNFVGSNAFSSLNIIFPFIMIFSAVGFMLGTGGCALVGKLKGETQHDKANEVFSMLIKVILFSGILLATLGIIFIKPISLMLGATSELLEDCIVYGTILCIAFPGFMLQTSFQTFVVVANKPQLGLHLTLLSGVLNVVLDYVFIVPCQMGIAGAAWATAIGQITGGVIPLFYFLRKNNKSDLRIVKCKMDFRALLQSAANGSSEMMTNISMNLVNILYNLQLMHLVGTDGVSAFGIIAYISFIFSGVFIGYTIGVSPVISFHHGARNKEQLRSLLHKSLRLIIWTSLILTTFAVLFAKQLAGIFVSYDAELWAFSTHALMLSSFSFLFSCVNIFGSAFFTALNNGVLSALISFLRTFVFQVAMIYLLPLILGIDGMWLAVTLAEILCVLVTIFLIAKKAKTYGY